MQTFILDHNIRKSAEYLDTTRLHKQAVEIKQILIALEPDSQSRWKSHPATQQWVGYEDILAEYGLACVDVWLGLGFKSSLAAGFSDRITKKQFTFPPRFCRLIPHHRALLRYKRWSHYVDLWPDEDQYRIDYHAAYLDENDKMFKVINGKRVYVTA